MFIVKYPDGRIINEKDMVWDDIPEGMNRVELTLPIPVSYIDPKTNETVKAPARTTSLKGFDKYYFYNEAVSRIAPGGGIEQELVAKAIGGIKGDNVIEVKIDKGGFSSVSYFTIEQLAQTGIKKGA